MANILCPLCGTKNYNTYDFIKTSDLSKAYKKSLGIGVIFAKDTIDAICCKKCGLKYFSPVSAGGPNLYENLQRFDWYYQQHKPEYNLAKNYLPDTGLVLEIGAGLGGFSNVVGLNRYIGLEFNKDAIQQACTKGIVLINESVEQHALNNPGAYAAVVSFQVMEHIENLISFINGCVDCVRPGGIIIFAVPNNDGIVSLAPNNILDMPPHHLTHWSMLPLNYIAKEFSLDLLVIEVEKVADFHRKWACCSIWVSRLRKFLRLQETLLDISLKSRAISKIATILSIILPPSVENIHGHTIIACYKKTNL
jgi:SAM-dependent methyltransferase